MMQWPGGVRAVSVRCDSLLAVHSRFSGAGLTVIRRTGSARMEHALGSLNYEGTLVQMHGSEASVMHVVHRVEAGCTAERITAMDEVGREIIRRGDEVTCIFPDQRTVIVGRRSNAVQPGPARCGSSFQTISALMMTTTGLPLPAAVRLVGRLTWMITVQPMDQLSLRLSPLARPEYCHAPEGADLGRRRFSRRAVAVFGNLPAGADSGGRPLNPVGQYRQDSPGVSQIPQRLRPRPARRVAVQPVWRAASLPPGFRLRTARSRQVEGGDVPMEQLVYSDGIASVSVFVESGVTAAEQGEGVSRIGAANAYTSMTGAWLVTAVGEVPVRTVEMIARSLERTDGDPLASELRQ